MQKALVITIQKEDKIKKQIQASILRKRKVLEVWMEKVESLRMELEVVKNEYNIRIGYLLLKDNQLDLEIIQLKNLKRLMDEGMTYDEAVKAEEDTFYNEILRMQKEQEKIEEEKVVFEKRNELPTSVQNELKELWKKLIRKFHPDLVTDTIKKAERESYMKQINKAYTTGDMDTLLQFENHIHVENIAESTITKLEAILIETENLIISCKEDFKNLRASEWYDWKKRIEKGKRAQVDIFAHLEKSLLDDVVNKISLLKRLRSEVHP